MLRMFASRSHVLREAFCLESQENAGMIARKLVRHKYAAELTIAGNYPNSLSARCSSGGRTCVSSMSMMLSVERFSVSA